MLLPSAVALAAVALIVPPQHVSGQFSPFNDFFNFRRRSNNTSRLPYFSRFRFPLPDISGIRTDLFGRNNISSGFSGGRSQQQQYETRLVGGRNSREGNVEVYVNDWRDGSRGWRAVCDVGWKEEHAAAVCRRLGFPGPAVATHDGRFGYRSPAISTSVSHCRVSRGGLQFCIHNGLEMARECSANDLAGVICGRDTSQSLNKPVEVRLVRGSPHNGDLEVKYEGSDWGPVCADGFDLVDAAVVCRALDLGAPLRSYISGQDAGKPFIMAGVECPTAATNLGQCRSERGPNVRCTGLNSRDRFNGAAVECTSDLPDLVIDHKEVERSAYIEVLTLDELECALDENCLASSARTARKTDTRTLLRFTNKVANVGTKDFRPRLHSSQWVWHSCHGHYHSSESFSEYHLATPGSGRRVAEGHKASFCLEDSECNRGTAPRYHCVQPRVGQRPPQGIRAGCSDIYSAYIDCQWLDVTDLKSGTYDLKIRVNADRSVPEASFANNMVVCSVRLTLNGPRAACHRRGNCPRQSVAARNCRIESL